MPISFDFPQYFKNFKIGVSFVWGGIKSVIDIVIGIPPLTLANALKKKISSLVQYGNIVQNGTPTKANPVDIVCNNGALKWDAVNSRIYADGTLEVLTVSATGVADQTALVENLLAYEDLRDEQDIISGTITRRTEAFMYDGSQTVGSRYISTTGGKDTGAIIVQPLGNEYAGDIVTFEAEDGEPIDYLSVTLTPTQDLHGYDAPWAGGAGVNKLDISTATPLGASYGLTKTIDSDGYVHLDGTVVGGGATLSVAMIKVSEAQTAELTGKGYIISAVDVSGGTVSSTWGLRDIDNGSIACSVPSAGEGTEIHMKFRFVVATTAQTAFTPYENICPITGTEKAEVVRTGKNVLNPILYDGGSYNPPVGRVWNLTVAPDARQFTDNHDGTFTYTTSSTWDYRTLLFPVKQSGERYNVSIQGASSGTLGRTVGYLDKDFTVLSRESTTVSSWTFESSLNPSADQDRAYFYIVITNRSTAVATITITNPSVVIDGDALPYEPFDPLSTTLEVEWGALGANQWDEEWESGAINLTTGQKQNNSATIRSKNYIPVKEGQTYYAKNGSLSSQSAMVFFWYKADYTYISYSYCANTAITAPADAAWGLFYNGSAYGTTYNHDISINYPATVATYEPYTRTIYGGHVDAVRGEMVLNRGYSELSEDWSWIRSSTYQGGYYANRGQIMGYKLNTPFMCSHAKSASNTSEYLFGTCYCDSTLNFRIMSETSTLQDWKDYIVAQRNNGTPITICYELATPITIPLDPHTLTALRNNTVWSDAGPVDVFLSEELVEQVAPQELKTSKGTNTITVTANVPVELKISYTKET